MAFLYTILFWQSVLLAGENFIRVFDNLFVGLNYFGIAVLPGLEDLHYLMNHYLQV